MSAKEPDDSIVATFRHHPMPNAVKSAIEGRPIFDDMEVCEVRFPGSSSRYVFPATAPSYWASDPQTGEQTRVTYAERFRRQYQQWREHATQTKTGTPLDYAPFLTEGKRAELKALNIFTVEALAEVDGQPLKNLGMYGRDLKSKAEEFISDARQGATNRELVAQLEQIKARNDLLEEDLQFVKNRTEREGEFEEMNLEQLRDYITSNSGHTPQGSLNRKTLVRMAMDVRPEKVA